MSEARFAVVIEDDADIRGLIAEVLTQAGFAVRTAASGAEGVELVRELEPTVTTLDVSMPGIDGFETARRIRESSTTYLVMITARSEEVDVLQGLQAGADDYVTKPFRPRELRARIDAMLRRPRLSGPDGDAADDWLERPGLRIDPARRTVLVDGEDPGLTRSEFDILLALIEARGRVLSKAALSQAIRPAGTDDWVSEQDERAIEVHVANLRRKLGDSAAAPRWIETVRGVGYRETGA
ncbi:MAG TPA: response regulator transcription factor [Microbacteriaceae bacterium]|nr:response regulator transcription factor [Microbacteriaceae bacterium]